LKKVVLPIVIGAGIIGVGSIAIATALAAKGGKKLLGAEESSTTTTTSTTTSEEEGFTEKAKNIAKKSAIPLGAAALRRKKQKQGGLTSSSEGEGITKKLGKAALVGKFLSSSSEGEHQGFGTKLKGAAKKAAIGKAIHSALNRSKGTSSDEEGGFSTKLKSKMHMPHFLQSSSELEEAPAVQQKTIKKKPSALKGAAKKAAGAAIIGGALNKAVGSSTSTSTTTSLEEEEIQRGHFYDKFRNKMHLGRQPYIQKKQTYITKY
jgi:hypothetical protein